jgi:hypothetical protein
MQALDALGCRRPVIDSLCRPLGNMGIRDIRPVLASTQ